MINTLTGQQTKSMTISDGQFSVPVGIIYLKEVIVFK